ncbi:MAG: DUF4340 domain-containing protein [Bacteroidota bacterium]
MTRRSVFTLGAIAVLALAAWLLMRQPGETSSDTSGGELLAFYDSAAVDRLEIRTREGEAVLEKSAGGWMLAHPVRYPADPEAVAAALGKGRSVRLTALVSTNPAKQHLFLVDSSGTLVRVFEKGTLKAAFRVGKPGPGFTETFVRREGTDEVYLGGDLLGYTFGRAPLEWRDKTVFSAAREAIREVRYRYGDTLFTLALTDSVWRVDSLPAAPGTVQPVLDALAKFQADRLIDTAVTAPPPLRAVIEAAGVQIRFHPDAASGIYFVQSSRSAQWFGVQSWRAEQVLKHVSWFSPGR